MATKTKGKSAATKGPPKRAVTGTRADSDKQLTPDRNEYLEQEFHHQYQRAAVFVEKLIERLTCYGENGKKLNDAFTNDEDLPPPIPKKLAETGSQPGDVGISSKLTKKIEELQQKLSKCEEEKQHLAKRNQELTDEVKNYKKPKNSANRPSSRPASAKHVPSSVSEDDIDTLKKNLQKHKDELRKVGEDKDTEITELKEENKSLKSKLEEQRDTSESLRRENAEQKVDIEKKTRDAEQLQREISDLKQNRGKKMEAEGIQRGKSDLTEDNEKLRKTLDVLRQENTKLIAENEKKTKDGEELQREISSLTKDRGKKMEAERIQRGKSDLTEDNELRKTLAALRQENATLIAENKKKTKDGEKLQREISSLTKDSESKRKEIEQLRKEKSDVIKDKQEKKNGGGKVNSLSSADEISKLKDEVEGLRNRLSKMAGAQLTDNNPAIADLSDPNRPLSLGEKFSELYDNEWTDAMEEMAKTMSDETKVIKLLLDIVCDAYKFCLDKSDRFMDKINSTLNGFSEEFSSSETMPKEIAKTNKDYRKSLAVYVVSFLQKDFAKEMKTKVKAKVGTQTEAYIKRCVLVCWFMTVQDPKVHITTKTKEKFDEDLYKPYTKKGKHLDYLVWPALHLHEGGPLIGKGVAQGKQ